MIKHKKNKRDILNFIWTFIVVVVTLTIKQSYKLGFWEYMLITIPLLAIGSFIINKFVKIK